MRDATSKFEQTAAHILITIKIESVNAKMHLD